MAKPVNGEFTIGELRRSLLAVVIDNPLFSDVEQLQANHTAYESESTPELAECLRLTRLEDARRGWVRRMQMASVLPQPSVCHCEFTAQAELRDLLDCKGLDSYQKQGVESCMATVAFSTRDKLRYLGWGYAMLLENQGKIPAAQGYDALKDN